MLDAAIVGLGWWGRYIVESQQGDGGAIRFIRGCDLDPDAAADFDDAKGLRLSADYADVLGDPKVQAVILTTPHAYHADQVVQAAQAGKHVLCEKPIALTAEEAQRLIEEIRYAR